MISRSIGIEYHVTVFDQNGKYKYERFLNKN